MNDISIDQIKQRALPILKKAGATKSAIFGSAARGEMSDDSDIDIIIDLPKGSSLFDLIDVQSELEKELNNEVDLITYNGMNKYVEPYILKDQVSIL